MYEVREYLTDEIVAICTRKDDAVAMVLSEHKRKLYINVNG